MPVRWLRRKERSSPFGPRSRNIRIADPPERAPKLDVETVT